MNRPPNRSSQRSRPTCPHSACPAYQVWLSWISPLHWFYMSSYSNVENTFCTLWPSFYLFIRFIQRWASFDTDFFFFFQNIPIDWKIRCFHLKIFCVFWDIHKWQDTSENFLQTFKRRKNSQNTYITKSWEYGKTFVWLFSLIWSCPV